MGVGKQPAAAASAAKTNQEIQNTEHRIKWKRNSKFEIPGSSSPPCDPFFPIVGGLVTARTAEKLEFGFAYAPINYVDARYLLVRATGVYWIYLGVS